MFFISPLLSLNYFLHYGNAEYKYIKKTMLVACVTQAEAGLTAMRNVRLWQWHE